MTYHFSFSQISLSPSAEISILTIAPGKSLNDTWGHSAIRINDKQLNFDVVYNYGMYDFNTPNFYTKFMQGKLLFDLGLNQFPNFLYHYSNENREVSEQILNLTATEKQAYFDFLQNNAKPKNKKYLYDFFFDNCATKLREVNTKILNDKVVYNDALFDKNTTFRELIYLKLDKHPWGKFGIDIALGSVIDRVAKPEEFSFLPSYAFETFKNAQIIRNNKSIALVIQTNSLYKQQEKHKKNSLINTMTPNVIFTIIALFVLWITFNDYKQDKHTEILDFSLLLITGLIGLLVVLLWFATDHTATKNNYTIFWAFLPNLIVAFYVYKSKKNAFLKKYYSFLIVSLFVMIILWIGKVQVFNLAMLPILLMLGVRYVFNILRLSKN